MIQPSQVDNHVPHLIHRLTVLVHYFMILGDVISQLSNIRVLLQNFAFCVLANRKAVSVEPWKHLLLWTLSCQVHNSAELRHIIRRSVDAIFESSLHQLQWRTLIKFSRLRPILYGTPQKRIIVHDRLPLNWFLKVPKRRHLETIFIYQRNVIWSLLKLLLYLVAELCFGSPTDLIVLCWKSTFQKLSPEITTSTWKNRAFELTWSLV